jgi:hypothetical protein
MTIRIDTTVGPRHVAYLTTPNEGRMLMVAINELDPSATVTWAIGEIDIDGDYDKANDLLARAVARVEYTRRVMAAADAYEAAVADHKKARESLDGFTVTMAYDRMKRAEFDLLRIARKDAP